MKYKRIGKNTLWLAACLCMYACSLSKARGQTNESTVLAWFQYKGELTLAKNVSGIIDLQHRRLKTLGHTSQHIIRPGIKFQSKHDVNITVGPALFWHNFDINASTFRFEIRPYAFLEWKQLVGKATIFHRSRFELRYNRKTAGLELLRGFNFNYRAGHKLGIAIPIRLLKSDKYNLELYDEVLINFGNRIKVNHLDQNRMYIGLKRTINKRTNLKFGYMYVFLPTNNVDLTESQHTIILGLAHHW